MNSRDAILGALEQRLRHVPEAPLPELKGDWVSYPDLKSQFVAAAGELPAMVVECSGSWVEAVEGLEIYRSAKRVLSLVEGLHGNCPVLRKPHAAASLDLTIARGQLGVAESGAIWVSGKGLGQRSALFLAQHLLLVLERIKLVPHLHAAYERIDVSDDPFGCFIAGPSKTADIEQALVVGAHGPRSLTIVLHD